MDSDSDTTMASKRKNSADVKLPLNEIVCGDALKVMKTLPDKSINLIVTSPPYNLKNSTGNGMKDGRGGKWSNAALINGYSHHDDAMPHDEYVAWQRSILEEGMRLLSDNGAFFYNHKWRVQAGLLQDRQDIVSGFPVRQIVIWRRAGGINFNPGYFLPTYEVIYIIAKKQFRLAPKANAYGDVWEFPQEMNNEHPAPFPVALIERIISSTTAQVVLDPFMGSGTTAVAAKSLDRDFIGIEISPEYCKLAEKRISSMANGGSLKLNLTARRPTGRKNNDDAQMSFFKASNQSG
jgi:site-specific DNA-methyltransferase (adenine-specific)